MREPLSTPRLADAIMTLIEAGLATVNVSMPGRVESYDASTQQVDVQPLVKRAYPDEQSARQTETLPIICNVPVRFEGSGDSASTYPISVGDTGLIVFCHCSIDRWLTTGGVVDPQDDRRHHLSDAVFLPGVRDYAHALSNVPTDAYCIRSPKKVQIGSPDASAGALTVSDGVDFMAALTQAIAANPGVGELAALKTALQALAMPGLSDPTRAGKSWPVGSGKVKVDD